MGGNVFKIAALLLLVAQQAITSVFNPSFHQNQQLIPAIKQEMNPTKVQQHKIVEGKKQEKIAAYNTKSEIVISKVAEKAVEVSKAFEACTPSGTRICDEVKTRPGPTDIPPEITPRPEPTKGIPEPTEYPVMTLIPTHKPNIPAPTVIPDPTAIPFPTKSLPANPQPCHPPCGPVSGIQANVICPDAQPQIMPCID